MTSSNRRSVLKAGAAVAGTFALAMPSIVRAQAGKLVIGHLTPLTGFLGVLGGYAQLGIRQALDEINQSGGVMGRQVELISEDSVNPQTAATKAQRMIEQDGAVVLLGEINSASALAIMQVAQRNKRVFLSTGARRVAWQELQPVLVSLRYPEHRDGQRRRHGADGGEHGQG
jgi:branched-chain amino acid transport system substrate-binding protein